MRLGLGLSLSNVRGGAAEEPFDITTLSHTGLWLDYGGSSPWAGLVSSRDLSSAAGPSAGTDLNGEGVASYNGTSHFLDGAICSTFFSASALSGWELVKVPSLASVGANADTRFNRTIFSSGASGQIWLYLVNTGKVGIGVATSGGNLTVETDFTADAWQLVQYRLSGGVLGIRVSGGSWATRTSVPDVSILNAVYRSGRSIVGDYLAMTSAGKGTSNTAWSDDDFDNLLAGARARWNLELA